MQNHDEPKYHAAALSFLDNFFTVYIFANFINTLIQFSAGRIKRMNLIDLSNKLFIFLRENGIKFNEEGFPLFTEKMMLKGIPEQILPLGHTSHVSSKERVLLVAFCNDEYIYKRLFTLEKDIPFYKQFMGFGGFDLSPRINWDLKLQKFNLLLNMMATVYLAIHGVKILPNFRTGCSDTITLLKCYPPNCWFIAGTIGCSRGHIKISSMYLRTKLLIANPDRLIIYGILKKEYQTILEEYGIAYQIFIDYQRVSRRKEVLK